MANEQDRIEYLEKRVKRLQEESEELREVSRLYESTVAAVLLVFGADCNHSVTIDCDTLSDVIKRYRCVVEPVGNGFRLHYETRQ